jgi:hypothetical protein
MTNTNKTWQAALAERGDGAFELFLSQAYDNSVDKKFYNHFSNEQVENRIKDDANAVRLKPIDDLVRLDIERYGDNAFLMYEWQVDDCMHPAINDCNYYSFESNKSIKSHIKAGNDVRRKPYANCPFNIEWAKAGVAMEFYLGINGLNPIAVNFISISPNNDSLIIVEDGYNQRCVKSCDLRHPFPSVCSDK